MSTLVMGFVYVVVIFGGLVGLPYLIGRFVISRFSDSGVIKYGGGLLSLAVVAMIVSALTMTRPAAPEMPEQQVKFIAAATKYASDYKNTNNEIKQAEIIKWRNGDLKRALNGEVKISDWLGEVERVGLTNSGDATVDLSVSSKVRIKTWNNSFSDIGNKTIVEKENPLFQQVRSLDSGMKVMFSGELVKNKKTFIREGSLTDMGSMTSPEFIFRFDKISRY